LPLTERNEINYQPAWSPTEDLIAYVSHKERHLYLMKPDGSQKRDTKAWGEKPRWSPDGKYLLHARSVIDAETGDRVRIYRADKEKQSIQMWPKWGKSGFVFVDSKKIGFTTPEADMTVPLLKNVMRRGSASDLNKEAYRW
jgi:Tol biopolymer transport system component